MKNVLNFLVASTIILFFTGCAGAEYRRSYTLVDVWGYHSEHDKGFATAEAGVMTPNGPVPMESTRTSWDNQTTSQSRYWPAYTPQMVDDPASYGYSHNGGVYGGSSGGVYSGRGQIYSGQTSGGIYRR